MDKNVLVIDDEEDIVNFLERFLKRFKIGCVTATSGEDALRVYDKIKFDYVFLDIHLKEMDGFTVLSHLQATNPAIKVIMITGSTNELARQKAQRMGVVDYISKPLDLNELKEKIQKYVL
jgi:DNA-binding response OmpR family regulator